MNAKYLVVIAAMTAMLVAATAFATVDSAFAGKKKSYEKSQASSQANACGSGEISVANFCQDIGAQNQGEENSVAQTGTQEINLDTGLGELGGIMR